MTLRVLLMMAVMMLAGCATTSGKVATGAAIGAATGGAIGSTVDPGPKAHGRIRNVVVGSLAGAAFGAGAGYAASQDQKEREAAAYKEGFAASEGQGIKASEASAAEPSLIPPRVDVRFVEDQVRGTTFIPAHFEYRIAEPARWQR